MKKSILFLLLILTTNVFAAGSWIELPSITGIIDNIIYQLVPDGNGNIFASIRTMGVYKTTNGGINWAVSGLTGNIAPYFMAIAPNGDIYAVSRGPGLAETISKSTNSGASWQVVYTKTFTDANYGLWAQIIFPANGEFVFAFEKTIWPTISDQDVFVARSTNGGNNWTDIGFIAPMVQTATGGGSGMILTSDNKLVLGTGQAGLLESRDYGISWQGSANIGSMFTSTVLKGQGENSVYTGTAYGLDRSIDNASTFDFIGPYNAWSYTNCAAISPQNVAYIQIADGRMYSTPDFGTTWTENHTGLVYGFHTDCFGFMNGKTYMAGHAPGLLEGKLYYFDNSTSVQTGSEIVKGFELKQNYPNPFNPSTKISFSIEKSSFVNLSVYDLLGKKVATLVDENKSTGSFVVNFGASQLSAGVYFYKLQSDGFSETKKMILTK